MPYEICDSIVAISSPGPADRVIIRVSGKHALTTAKQLFDLAGTRPVAGIKKAKLTLDDNLSIEAILYSFLSPHSYTGEDLIEIHMNSNQPITQALMQKLLAMDLRMAGPGEFTARAYLNGKIDLAQAEAVNEIIVSSNRFQLIAAEKLLAGGVGEKIAKIRESIIDCLSLIEAALDFSDQEIELITNDDCLERLNKIRIELNNLSEGSISYENIVDLPAVGIAGAANAGKSSLTNTLLGTARSMVSETQKTTRDVLTGRLELQGNSCILFDCAGLILAPVDIMDKLAQSAAVEALNNASIVVYCLDVSKPDFTEDIELLKLIKPQSIIAIAIKSDLLPAELLPESIAKLNRLFNTDFTPVSNLTGEGIDSLRESIDTRIIELNLQTSDSLAIGETADARPWTALTARHKQKVTEAIHHLTDCCQEAKSDRYEIAAMMLRAAYESIVNIDQQRIDDKVLEKIFSHFCIGK